jgi:hypothetical protein
LKQVYTTTLRLNLEKEADREAWEHLRRVDRKQYHSVNSAVIAAVNAYFSRKGQLEADPYLEIREKEDAFLEKVVETLQEGLRQSTVPGLVPLLQLLQGAQAEHQHRPRSQRPTQGRTGTRHWTLRGAFDINPYNLRKQYRQKGVVFHDTLDILNAISQYLLS